MGRRFELGSGVPSVAGKPKRRKQPTRLGLRPVVAAVVPVGHHQNPDADGTLQRLVVSGPCHQHFTQVRGWRTVVSDRRGEPLDRLGECVPDGEAGAVAAAEVVDCGDEVEEPGAALVEGL